MTAINYSLHQKVDAFSPEHGIQQGDEDELGDNQVLDHDEVTSKTAIGAGGHRVAVPDCNGNISQASQRFT